MTITYQGEAGTDPLIKWQSVPTGGIVVLNLESSGAAASWQLTRFIVTPGGLTSPVVLVSGSADQIPLYIDLGDGNQQNVPLSPQSLYAYEFATARGAVTTDTITVSGAITLEPDHMTKVMARAIQAGLQSLVLPAEWAQRPTFSYAMPITTQLRFPMVLLNLDLLQQSEIPIGQGIAASSEMNVYNVPAMALRRYVVRVYATNVDERDFYRDAIIAIFNSILAPMLEKIGVNVSHSFQAANGQIVGDQFQPGAFYSEIALQFSGLYNVAVSTYFPLIEHITFDITERQYPG